MLLKVALLLSMLFQIGAAIAAVSLIHRTRYNASWILISLGFVLMGFRGLIEFSGLFWETQLISKETVTDWIGVLVSLLIFLGLIFIRKIFNLLDRIAQLREERETYTLSAVIQAEEKARQTFARDLHDGIGPLLSSIKMTMSAVDIAKLDRTNKKIIERSCLATDEVIVALKEISNHLSPHLLVNYGLTKSLETLASQMLANASIRFKMKSEIGENRYLYELEISLYRIVSELLNNTLKHSGASKAHLRISEHDNGLYAEYSDNGSGCDLGKDTLSGNAKGMGLENIRSRIKSLRGQLNIETKHGGGFTAYIYIPLK